MTVDPGEEGPPPVWVVCDEGDLPHLLNDGGFACPNPRLDPTEEPCRNGWEEGCQYHLPDDPQDWCVPCLRRGEMTCTCPPPDGDDPSCEFHGAGRYPKNDAGHACRRDAIVDGICIDCERPPMEVTGSSRDTSEPS